MDSSTAAETALTIFEALARHDVSILDRTNHPDAVDDFIAIEEVRGVPAIRALFEEIFSAMPDFALRVDNVVSDGDQVVVQWTANGTFTGAPFQGVHPTGRRVSIRGCDVMQFEDGRLRHNTIYYDGLGFARDIGLLPRKGSSGDRAMTAAFNLATDLRARVTSRSTTPRSRWP